MQRFEYKVIPAPEKGLKARGVKAGAPRFAHALESVMNELGAEGWDYVRADTLPCSERSGLTSHQTVYRNVLVFRRALSETAAPAVEPEAAPAPALAATKAPAAAVAEAPRLSATPADFTAPRPPAARDLAAE